MVKPVHLHIFFKVCLYAVEISYILEILRKLRQNLLNIRKRDDYLSFQRLSIRKIVQRL